MSFFWSVMVTRCDPKGWQLLFSTGMGSVPARLSGWCFPCTLSKVRNGSSNESQLWVFLCPLSYPNNMLQSPSEPGVRVSFGSTSGRVSSDPVKNMQTSCFRPFGWIFGLQRVGKQFDGPLTPQKVEALFAEGSISSEIAPA